MGGNELLAAIANLTQELAPFWDLAMVVAYLAGLCISVIGFLTLTRDGQRGTGVACLIFGALLLGLPTIMDAASQTLFNMDAPKGLSTAAPGGGADRVFIAFAVAVAALIGVIAVIRSLIMASKIGSGTSNAGAGPAIVYFVAGILCINLVTVTRILGASIGGVFHDVVTRLFGAG
jgi:hypothetical protein